MTRDQVYGALFGVAIGDALGVPAEFTSRASLQLNPIKDYVGYKSHRQPPGTFSDDTSLTFCLASSLCNGYDLHDIGDRFTRWHDSGYWTAGGDVFAIGMTTSRAISRLKKDAVLMGVNLGSDADTTAAVTGGLAGLYYGFNSIPAHWRSGIKRSADISDLSELVFISFS